MGDAHLAAYFFVRALGFQLIADAGFEHQSRDRRSISLGSGAIRLILTSPLGPESSISRFFAEHGDGVRDIAFEVSDCAASFEAAMRAGATVAEPPREVRIGDTRMLSASVRVVGDLVYSFVERHGLRRSVYPTVPVVPPPRKPALDPTLVAFDHFAICVRRGELDPAVAWHENVLGMTVAHEELVEGSLGGMRSKALQTKEKLVKIVLLEPAGANEGQIDDFLRRNAGPGVQHFAVLTDDIFAAVSRLRDAGVRLLKTPGAYYDELPARLSLPDAVLGRVRELDVLADTDPGGLLLQAFTAPIHARGTMFFELIERRGSEGFGTNNIRALFRAVEIEQLRRREE